MKPTLAQYQNGGSTWVRKHRGISYTLSHHGISEYSPEGTWCYYLHLPENMFQNPDHFALFNKEREIKDGFGEGQKWESYNYYDIPDLSFHGGVTWYSKDTFFDRNAQRDFLVLKIGCDYGHAFDRDGGYWEGIDDVDRDARRSIDVLADQFPMMMRCAYSGTIDTPENFYTAVNGACVHNSQIEKLGNNWPTWLPANAGQVEETA